MYMKPIAFVAFAIVTAQAATLYPIGQASTAGFAQGSFTGARPRGWDFQVNASGVQVTQMGVNAAIGDNITLTLWDNASMTELAQIVVASTASTWVFGNLGSPVNLVSGNTYSVIGWDNNVDSSWYLFNNTPPAAFNPTGTIQYLDTRVGNLIDQNTYPTTTLASPAMYGVTDIGYVIAASVPEPASLSLTAFGVALLFLVRSRRANARK